VRGYSFFETALVLRGAAAECFLRRVMRLVSQHALLGGAAASAFLAANFFEPGALGIGAAFPALLNFVEQEFAGEKAILTLLARALAFDLQPGRSMQ
jgi:hypothetical protein